MKEALNEALWRLLPGQCVLCGLPSRRRRDLCAVCEGDLPWWPNPCPRCALPLPPETSGPCGRCSRQPPPWHRAHAAFIYADPADLLVRLLKYRRQRPVARVMADLMAPRMAVASRPEALVSVPMPWRRQWQRGFNQSELLARELGAALDLPVLSRALRRRAARPPQAGLPLKARQRNARGAFAARRWVPRHVTIVDDVATTGSTLEATTRALQQAGAARVDVWLFARTPPTTP